MVAATMPGRGSLFRARSFRWLVADFRTLTGARDQAGLDPCATCAESARGSLITARVEPSAGFQRRVTRVFEPLMQGHKHACVSFRVVPESYVQ